jgi:uncharacterized protein
MSQQQQSLLLFSLLVVAGVWLLPSLATSKKMPNNNSAVVTELIIYPIKSCKGIKVSRSIVTKRGLQFDRLYVVVDKNGRFASQRKFPRMTLIVTTVDTFTRSLHVDAPNMPRLSVTLDEMYLEEKEVAETVRVNVWGDDCEGISVGGKIAAKWFDDFLQTDGLRLVRMKDSFVRRTDPEYSDVNGQTGFADGFPFLLASEESLAALNTRLQKPVSMAQFRPNIVVTHGQSGACSFAEDSWKRICVVPASSKSWVANVVKPCSRCTMPNVNPATGEFSEENEPTKTLKTFRTGKDLQLSNPKWAGQVFFGQNLDHDGQDGLEIAVGDRMDIFRC